MTTLTLNGPHDAYPDPCRPHFVCGYCADYTKLLRRPKEVA